MYYLYLSDEITAKNFNKSNESNNLREQMKQKEEGEEETSSLYATLLQIVHV